MPTYSTYGLVVDSELRLPELDRVRSEPDVCVRVGEVPETPDGRVEDYRLYGVRDGDYLSVSGVGAVYATAGRRLIVDPAADVDPGTLRWLVLGQGFRMVLHQRGYVVLHAGATVVDGRAVAFLGDSGGGKSTTVAAWYASGYPVLADDVTPVDPDTGLVRPGFPGIKLDRESAAAVDADFAPVGTGADRRQYYAAPPGYRDGPVPLGTVYLLADGPELHIEDVPPSERPFRLMCGSASTYGTGDDEAVEPHFEDCARLAEGLSMKRLYRPREFDILPDLVSAVEADLRGTSMPAATSEG